MSRKNTLAKLKRVKYSQLQKENKYLNDRMREEGGYIDQCINALDTLITFAGFLPNIIQNEIFTYDKVKELNAKILHGNNEGLHIPSNMKTKVDYSYSDGSHASRKLQLAHILGELQTKTYKEHWENENIVPPNKAAFSAIRRLKAVQQELKDLGKTRVTRSFTLKSVGLHASDCKCQSCEKRRARNKIAEISKSEIL